MKRLTEVSAQEWMYYGDVEDFMFEVLHLQVSLFTLSPHFPPLVMTITNMKHM